MATPGTLVTAVIAVVVVGAIVQLLFLAYRYRNGDVEYRERSIDGDVGYPDQRIDEVLYARSTDDDGDPDVDPGGKETVTCPACRTLNEDAFTFCRNCISKLPGG